MIAVNTSEPALPDDYPRLLAELKGKIRSAQWTAARVVNTQLIELYWTIGKAILERQNAEGWGTRVIDRLSDDLRAAYPDMTGLSRSNIHYMRQMAAAWCVSATVPQAVGQLPWATSGCCSTSSMRLTPWTGTPGRPSPVAGLATSS
jgi:hypothetical protein